MPERTQTVYLYLEGVTAPTDDSTAYRVFLDCKQPGITTPVSDPTYAGTINFFGAGHGDHGNAVSFALDVTQTLGKLVSQGVYSANTPIEAAFVPVNVRKTEMVIKSDVKVQKIRLVSLGQA